MADTVAIKVTADIVDLQTKFTLAKAESQALTNELNKLAREAVAAGGATPQLNSQLQQLSAQSIAAKEKVSTLSAAMREGQDHSRNFGNAINFSREALGAFGIAVTAEAVIEFNKNIFDASAEVYHHAEVLGLTSTQYQVFAKSAQFSGVAVDTVDVALKRFNAAQGLAQAGTGAQAKAFNDLGVSAALPAQEALPAIAQALLSITDVARRSRDEVALFGRSGEELNPALEAWARGFFPLEEELQKTGHLLASDTVKAAHDAKMAMDEAWDQVQVSWAPNIISLTGLIADLGKEMANLSIRNIPANVLNALAAMGDANFPESPMGGRFPYPSAAPSDEAGAEHLGHGRGNHPLVGLYAKTTPPNWTDDADRKKAESEARQVADEMARIYEQGNQRHIQNEEQTNAHLLSMGRETLDQWRDQAIALEDERYQAAKDGLQKRAAADAGDKVRLARDMAEEAQLARDHADRLEQIDQQFAEKKQQQANSALAAFIKEQDEELAVAMANFDKQFREQKISADQRHASEVDLTRQIEDEVLRRFDAEHASLVQGTAAYEDAMRQRAEIATKYNKVVRDADTKLATDQAQTYETANRQILSVESNFISGFLSGRNTLGQSALQLFAQLLERELEADVAYWTERELLALEGIGKEKLVQQEGLLEQLAEQLFFNTQSAASSAAAQAAGVTGAAAGAAASKVQAAAEIPAFTGIASMAAAASVADIPIVGPELAAAAFAEMQALGASALGMAALDVGTNMVPTDMVALIHAGERVIPAADNSALMSAVAQNGSGADGGGNTIGGDTYHLHLMMPPGTKDAAQFGRSVAKAFRDEMRNGNPDLKKAVAGR